MQIPLFVQVARNKEREKKSERGAQEYKEGTENKWRERTLESREQKQKTEEKMTLWKSVEPPSQRETKASTGGSGGHKKAIVYLLANQIWSVPNMEML